jgi:hypothetical protein
MGSLQPRNPPDDFLSNRGARIRGIGFLAIASLLAIAPSVPAGQPVPASPVQAAEVLPLIEPQGQADLEKMDQRIYLAAQNLARYLRTLVHPWEEDQTLALLTDSRSGEHHIRPNTGAVHGFCFLCRFGPYDESVVGVSRSRLLGETVIPMIRYLVATHVTGTRPTGDRRPWGDAWQSAHWAQKLGCGAWYVWDELPEDVRSGVRRVVAHEADRIAGSTPPHQIRLDTKAEENAWNSRILSVVQLLLPDDSRRPGWESAFQKWALSSLLRPADERSTTMVDGRTVAAQFSGANIHDDFTLENHNIVHPDYMTCISLSLGAELDYALSGRRPPECLHYNVAEIYENLKWFMLPDGGFVYPNGQDWQLFRNADWTVKSVMMSVFLRDPDAWSLACPCVETLEKMQARSETGTVYAPGETFFASTQTDLLSSLATSWLVLKTADRIERAPRDRVGVRRLDSGKILLRRTGSAIHTVSWGPQVMAQCVPYQHDRMVSPDQRNGIGQVVLANQQKPLPIRLRDAKVTSGEDGFKAELVVDHGEQVRAELLFASNPDGSFTMREKLVALTDVATSRIATGQIGILNNPGWVYERGRRAIAIDEREEDVPALSGKKLGAEAVREMVVDGVLRIRGARPLQIQYHGADQPSRSRATDRLYLNHVDGQRSWRTGETVSEYEAVVDVIPSRP